MQIKTIGFMKKKYWQTHRLLRDREIASSTPCQCIAGQPRSTQPSIPPGQVNRVPSYWLGLSQGAFTCVGQQVTVCLIWQQGRSQKFVLGGIKFFGGIKLLNSRSDVIFIPIKSLIGLIWGGIYPDIPPVATMAGDTTQLKDELTRGLYSTLTDYLFVFSTYSVLVHDQLHMPVKLLQ